MRTLLRAAWVAPMDRPIIRDGGVVIEGDRIVEVGEAKQLRGDRVEDFGDAIILPGLINAHTHLELSNCTAGEPPTSFIDWIAGVARRPNRDDAAEAIATGISQCLRFGVTTVGDISQQMHLTRPLLRESRLRAVSYGEVLGLGSRRGRFEQLLPLAVDRSLENERMTIGLTPHAPYTVDLPGYLQCLELAKQNHLPLATHLAESPHEQEFLEHHRGVFRELWERLGSWQEPVETFKGSPVRFAHAIGLLDFPTLLAHVNYCDDDELDLLANGQASVVYCPRTHAYFGHPPHRFHEMLARGINVALGTDSCASSPDLNIVDEMRLVHRIAPDMPAHAVWEMITTRGAAAIRQGDRVGSLSPGKFADYVVFPAKSDKPLAEIIESDVLPTRVTTRNPASRD